MSLLNYSAFDSFLASFFLVRIFLIYWFEWASSGVGFIVRLSVDGFSLSIFVFCHLAMFLRVGVVSEFSCIIGVCCFCLCFCWVVVLELA